MEHGFRNRYEFGEFWNLQFNLKQNIEAILVTSYGCFDWRLINEQHAIVPYVLDSLHVALNDLYSGGDFWTCLLNDTKQVENVIEIDQVDLIINACFTLEHISVMGFQLPEECFDLMKAQQSGGAKTLETAFFLESSTFEVFDFGEVVQSSAVDE
jgi:hypothetical protein